MNVPSQDDFHHDGHRIHIDAAHQNGHDGERNCGEGSRALAIPEFQITRDRVRLADVVKRHHHQRKKQNRRDRANPISMRYQNSILIGCGGIAHHLQRTKICRDEAQASDPSRHLTTRHKEFFARVGELLQVKPQSDHQHEVHDDDDEIDGAKSQPAVRRLEQQHCRHYRPLPTDRTSGKRTRSSSSSSQSFSKTFRKSPQCSISSTVWP